MSKKRKPREPVTRQEADEDTVDTEKIENDEKEQPIGDDLSLIQRRLMIAHTRRRKKKPHTKRRAHKRKKKNHQPATSRS